MTTTTAANSPSNAYGFSLGNRYFDKIGAMPQILKHKARTSKTSRMLITETKNKHSTIISLRVEPLFLKNLSSFGKNGSTRRLHYHWNANEFK